MIQMITLYSGNGKGKTLACIGATVKASIKDKKVLFVDFINKDYVSELKAMQAMYTVTTMAAPVDLEIYTQITPENKPQLSKIFRELFDSATRTVILGKFDLLILDGVFDAAEKGLLPDSDIYDFLSNAPNNLDIICTGIEIGNKFTPLATFVTELSDKKTNEESPS